LVNEFHYERIAIFRTQVVVPIMGEGTTTLTEAQWRDILAKFAPYQAWLKAKPATAVEPLGVDKIRAYLNACISGTPGCPYAIIRVLIDNDRSVAGGIQQLQNLEKLLLYHQWLFTFVNNYVSFTKLFNLESRAMFEMGTLVLEGREFSFNVRVGDRRAHSDLARNGGMYLLYLQITGSDPAKDNFEVAVPVTRGSARNFHVGKRGIFYTLTGKELDAQIVQIVENPISFWESMKDPFRRVWALITRRFEQIAASIQKETETAIGATGVSVERSIQMGLRQAVPPAGQTAVSPAPVTVHEPARPSGTLRDIMIGAGFLTAGLSTAFKLLTDSARQLSNMQTLTTLLIIITIFLAVTVLATALNACKNLRRRDLGIILQASGWAVNGRMRLIKPMSRFFSRRVRIPRTARKHRKDLLIPIEKLARQK